MLAYYSDNAIEYVDSFVHLGHVITNQLVDNDDILKMRNEFVGQVNIVLCFFSKLKSSVVGLRPYINYFSHRPRLLHELIWVRTSVTHPSKICVSHGGEVYDESEDRRSLQYLLIVICCRF